ncbi:MAG TPA: 6-bladed beta-propeller [Gemmatimonas sp.]|uniref:6-bladed beta-propeller n=1 Tax=Gemmatimonas sp. TaxID=1962908 RepID=UPI002ED8CA80
MTLTAFAKVRLKDRDTVFIGKPNALAVSQRGEYFVTDIPSRRVLRFDASGSFMETIGRRGGGPNEFEGPAWLTPIDDTTLVIADLLRRRAVLWHLASKTVTAYLPLPGLVSPLVYVDRTLYTAAPDVEHGTAGIRWRPGAGEPERLGQVLDVYRDLFWAIWGEPALAVAGDSILYFGGRSEYVIIADRDWQPRDSLPIPRTARRGIPREIDYTVGEGRNIYDVGKQLSQPFGLRILSGGRLAVFHLDASVVNNSLVVGRVFMTVIPRAKAPRCIDVQVPAHDSTSIPRLSFLADTLFVLDHFVDGDSVVAEVSKYHIGAGLC